MADIRDKPDIQKVEQDIHHIAKYGSITPTDHCYERMAQKDYSTNDLYNILIKGKINLSPEFDDSYENWKYRVEGKTIDGDETVVVTVIISHREVLCITIFSK